MKKIFILLIKYIPIVQMIGMLLNNILYFYDIYSITYILDFLIGNSLIATFLLYVCSYVFKFCSWHRLIITANLLNIVIASIDAVKELPMTDMELITTYLCVSISFIIIALANNKIKKK